MKINQKIKRLENLRALRTIVFSMSFVSLLSLMPLQAQEREAFTDPVSPLSVTTPSDSRTPFSKGEINRTVGDGNPIHYNDPNRAIGGGGGGAGNPTGGEDDPANVNDNEAPVEDAYWLLPLLAVGYCIYSRRKAKSA